jgi:hypothetical protein
MDDFKSWVIREKIATELQLSYKPGLLSELASNDKWWNFYEQDAEARHYHEMSGNPLG